jgi:hypothetical protein
VGTWEVEAGEADDHDEEIEVMKEATEHPLQSALSKDGGQIAKESGNTRLE